MNRRTHPAMAGVGHYRLGFRTTNRCEFVVRAFTHVVFFEKLLQSQHTFSKNCRIPAKFF